MVKTVQDVEIHRLETSIGQPTERSMVSIVIPVWNEDPRNLKGLHGRLVRVLDALGMPWEVIFSDDGSTGVTVGALEGIAAEDPRVRVVRLARRYGQETAVVVGLLAARGELVCTMDGDLQNRPEDIPRMLGPLREGYDLVLGKRDPRGASSVLRRFVSRMYGAMMRARWRTRISDWGCGFNAIRRDILEVLRDRLLHRSGGPLKTGLIRRGVRWTEVEITQDPRPHGRSRYRWAHFCWHAIRMLLHGTSLVVPRHGQVSIMDADRRRPS